MYFTCITQTGHESQIVKSALTTLRLGRGLSPCTQHCWGHALNPVFTSGSLTPGKTEEHVQRRAAGGGFGAQGLWEAAEGTGAVKPGEKEARRETYCSLHLPSHVGGNVFSQVASDRRRGNGLKLSQKKLRLDIRNDLFMKSIEQAGQGSRCIIILGDT